jgi:hypothetical protein
LLEFLLKLIVSADFTRLDAINLIERRAVFVGVDPRSYNAFVLSAAAIWFAGKLGFERFEIEILF